MKCFYHPDTDAVALCKSCNRGLCPACSAEVAPGLACRGRCEADVAALNLVIQRSNSIYQKTGTTYLNNAITYLLIGTIFLGSGLIPMLVSGNYRVFFLIPLGAVFLLWSFLAYRSGKQMTTGEAKE
jgi:hypothetical protein